MEYFPVNGRDLIYEKQKEINDDLIIAEYIDHRFEVCVNDGRPTGIPHTEAVLSVSDEGKAELFKRSHAEIFKGITYEEFKNSGDKMTVRLLSYFNDNSAKMTVEFTKAASADEKPDVYFRGEVLLSLSLQEELNRLVEAQIKTSLEDFIADKLSDIEFGIKPLAVFKVCKNAEPGYINCWLELSERDLRDLMDRSNAYRRFGFINRMEYLDHTDSTCVVATISPKSVWVDIIRYDKEKGDTGRTVSVPCRDVERNMITELAEHAMKKTIKEVWEESMQEELEKAEGDKQPSENRKPKNRVGEKKRR